MVYIMSSCMLNTIAYHYIHKYDNKNKGLTLRSCVSIPGRIMITHTKVPISKKKEKTKRVMVELFEEGQQPHKRHGAEPHRHEACRGWRGRRRER